MMASIYLHSCQCLLSVFMIIAILLGVKWYLTVVLICISWMTNDGEHIFMCLPAISVHFLVKRLFKSFFLIFKKIFKLSGLLTNSYKSTLHRILINISHWLFSFSFKRFIYLLIYLRARTDRKSSSRLPVESGARCRASSQDLSRNEIRCSTDWATWLSHWLFSRDFTTMLQLSSQLPSFWSPQMYLLVDKQSTFSEKIYKKVVNWLLHISFCNFWYLNHVQ